ncbi:MAG: hypothetical protein JSW14_05035 [Candidatus Bathyarchaeum sp.]|nr:MAG: hypothetical protein JSW14_05035 [Candidatus Bathyarchaeum sp.]
MKNVRVQTWEEFKGLAIKQKPKSIVYIIAQSIPTKNLTSLKLLLPLEGVQYIFTDTAKGDKLRRTGIPIRTDKKGNRFLEDADIKNFLKTQLQRKDLRILSYWTI